MEDYPPHGSCKFLGQCYVNVTHAHEDKMSDRKLKELIKRKAFFVFSILTFFLCHEFLLTETLSQETEGFFDVQKTLNELEKRVYSDTKEEKKRRQIVKNVYSLIKHEFTSSTKATSAVKQFKKSIPSMPERRKTTWKERLSSRFEVKDTQFVINTMSWKSMQYDLLVVQIDYTSYLYRETGHPASAAPMICLKSTDSAKVIFADLSTWLKSGFLPSTYTINGLIHQNGVECPDVLISTGPTGSGYFVYFYQMHYDKLDRQWKMVWKDKRAYITNVEYPKDNGEIFVSYIIDKYKSPETTTTLFELKWEGRWIADLHGAIC